MSDVTKTCETPKALLVAKDVLEHLSEYRVNMRTYIRGPVDISTLKPGDVQNNLDLLMSVCKVCALGACVLSKARLYDAVPVSSFTAFRENGKATITMTRFYVEEHLADVFSYEQLCLIECAFEKSELHAALRSERIPGVTAAAVAFGSRYADSRGRLAAIMQNVIDNDGIFKPPATAGETEDQHE